MFANLLAVIRIMIRLERELEREINGIRLRHKGQIFKRQARLYTRFLLAIILSIIDNYRKLQELID